MRGWPSCHIGNPIKQRGEKKLLHKDMTSLYAWSMSQFLPIGEFHEKEITQEIERMFLKTILGNLDENYCGYLFEFGIEYSYRIHEKTKHFPRLPDKKQLHRRVFNVSDGKNRKKKQTYRQTEYGPNKQTKVFHTL